MSIRTNLKVTTIAAAGATVTYDCDNSPEQSYRITTTGGGAVALAGNQVFQDSGTPVPGQLFIFYYEGQVTIGAFSLTFFGTNLTAGQALYRAIITCFYTGSAWKVFVHPDATSGNESIVGTDIVAGSITNTEISASAAIAITKLAALAARGYMIRGGVNGVLEGFNAATSGNLLIGDGTDIRSVAMSGGGSINSGGVFALVDGTVTPAKLSFSLTSYLEVTRTLTSAEILALRTTPIEIISAPGPNKYLELISASACLNYNTATYNAGADLLNLEINGVALWAFSNAFVEATADTATQGAHQTYPLTALNTALNARMSSADPTTGDSTITIHVIYSIRNFS